MQKKSVLLVCASGIIRVGEGSIRGLMRETQLLCLSRLLLLFDYIMKHLYDAPPLLLQQVTVLIIFSDKTYSQLTWHSFIILIQVTVLLTYVSTFTTRSSKAKSVYLLILNVTFLSFL